MSIPTHRHSFWRDWVPHLRGYPHWIGARWGYWKELGQWPIPGRIWHWHGTLPELWYYIKCRFWRRYNVVKVRTLPPTWTDPSELIMHAMFEILEFSVEKDGLLNTFYAKDDLSDAAPEGQQRSWQEAAELWYWWTVRRPERVKAREAQLHEWHEAYKKAGSVKFNPVEGHAGISEMVFPKNSPEADYADQLHKAYHVAEEADNAEDLAMMHRLVDLSPSMWT